jgi:hypothetical protein
VRRPNEYSPQVQPMIQTPVHGSLPSGHSTEAHAVARVLAKLVELIPISTSTPPLPPATAVHQLRKLLMRQAARIAINRTVAGVHYPVDSLAGQMLGLAVGQYFIARATGSGASVDSWSFDGEAYPDLGDFSGSEIYDVQNDALQQTGGYLKPNTNATITVDTAPCLKWLWDAAQGEWK